jgi:hypothetical protein
MSLIIEDRVLETSTSTGTGDFALAGALTGYRAFSAVCTTNDTFYYMIEAIDLNGAPTGDWEAGLGTYSAANTLTRTAVSRSSNSNAAVSFSAGTKRVAISAIARSLVRGPVRPGGRLTLVTGTPVLTSDQTAQTSIFYTPYQSDVVPISNGSSWAACTFTELNLTLDTTNHASGSLYDVFVWSNAGVIIIGTGPAWSSTTARGTGAGTTELQMLNGIQTNKNSITLINGAGTGTSGIAANTATYVGTFYATAAGQTGMAFKPAAAAGGTNNFLALFNAYNRVRVGSVSRDSTSTWTYSVTTWRSANASASNRISFIGGLPVSTINAEYMVAGGSGTGAASNIGLNLDSTTAAPNICGQVASTSGSIQSTTAIRELFSPSLGLHFIQAMEISAVSGVNATFFGAQTSPTRQMNALTVELEM